MNVLIRPSACLVALLLMLSSALLHAAPTAEPVLRFAVLGDAEPKPLAEFPGLARAVDHVNALAAAQPMNFVVGVGDIAHKGTQGPVRECQP